jgi:putative ATP-binding cassette transporter
MLLRYVRTHAVVLIVTAILSAASAAVTILLLANILESSRVSGGSGHRFIVGILLMLALLVSGAGSQLLLARLGGVLVSQLRIELCHRFLDIEYEKLINRKDLVFGAIIQDIGLISPLVLKLPQLAYNIVLILLCWIYLAQVSLLLFAVFVVFIGITIGTALAINRSASAQYGRMLTADDEFFRHVRTISDGKKELMLNEVRTRHFVDELLHPAIGRSRMLLVKLHLLLGINTTWATVTVIGAVFTIVYLGQVLALPLETTIRFVVGAVFVIGPLMMLISVLQGLASGLASLRHLEEVGLGLKSEANGGTSGGVAPAEPVAGGWSCIAAEDLYYAYRAESDSERPFAVGPFNLEIRRGEMLFIVGGNGSGKSTILRLLCGLVRPSAGRLLIDGQPVHDELAGYRSRFAGVFGDFFLFSHVLDAKGGLLGDAEAMALLRRLALDSQTSVRQGELTKVNLSTGQRKRLALLQCYAEDREIYFFDEWAADQDVTFREQFYTVILPELKRRGKTLIVITHDDRYFHVADRVIKLESGLIVADSAPAVEPMGRASGAE